jgi:hypothetical protein
MGKSNASEQDVLKYILQGVAPAWSAATDLFIALHTADPGEAGTQETSEAAYTGYTRVTTSRSTSAWTISSTTLGGNIGVISFPACTDGSAVATHVSVGVSFSGAGEILYSGTLTASLSISAGITPSFNTSSLTIAEE